MFRDNLIINYFTLSAALLNCREARSASKLALTALLGAQVR